MTLFSLYKGYHSVMVRVIRQGSTITLPPSIVAQLGDETELEVTVMGHGIYIETAAEARQREAGLRQLDAVLARRRTQQPDANETPEDIDEIVRLVKEVRRQHATPCPL
jgi:hypothetical protein